MSNRDLVPDFDDTEEKKAAVTGPKIKEQIHIRYQQVSSRRSLTIIQGLPKKLDCDKVLSFFKKSLCCGGEIIAEENGTKVIQLNGDHRQKVAEFFIKEKIAPKEMVIVHGT
ncbi:Translation initiation factor SUI1 family protein [Trichomonas vaginalis G3]|uniref:Translation initiation factor SUI1 family protein n=1 Tax=Trichomonas vaginalis (strain ATCC PRA-98 / G3) TaxID=412133 RepID=A2DSB0_TRIV3|nr:translation initiation factor protein [Trichomonas vaginalis G3]EAY16689.1 Translation initiation factor SUI1 family protein [Trichomonas vaginalis G3]KAI5543111.1 translation initiation factor protein [Trichomonas vaginalis G3]|eukprot:XP_001328912.1 Translation initiation factor SUI1 family protein [Trichomonas vaginalis G3]